MNSNNEKKSKTSAARPEAKSQAPEEVVVESAQDVISQFLSKGKSNAAKYIDIIDEMMDDYLEYNWAESTLLDIYDFIKKEGYITEKQIEAVENIRQSHL